MTNNIQELHFDSIILDMKSNNAKQVLQQLAAYTSTMIGTSEDYIAGHLLNAEKTEGTCIGHGVALAHMQLPRLTKPMIILATLATPVTFNGKDEDPVDLACLVLSPEFEGIKHLSRLAMVTRSMVDDTFCEKLRSAETKDQIKFFVHELNSHKKVAA
jgi:PTS system nitrogen regulatory IIA component